MNNGRFRLGREGLTVPTKDLADHGVNNLEVLFLELLSLFLEGFFLILTGDFLGNHGNDLGVSAGKINMRGIAGSNLFSA